MEIKVARYSLIMKDTSFMVLMEKSGKEGKSLGKFLNEIIDSKADEIRKEMGDVKPEEALCLVCGKKATIEGHGKGNQKLFVCSLHKSVIRKLVDGWKDLVETRSVPL